jgi:oxygen-independent coproporphyrinogen-3 oxidase
LAGIYIHIPFCKQACHYCNFHFATSLRHKNELVAALLKETELRAEYFGQELVETIYFGGGTPSLLEIEDLGWLVEKIKSVYLVSENTEITLEANPDDINEEKLTGWKATSINRLSIGVQSFFNEDLLWMNRAHTDRQARQNLRLAKKYFENITVDLIYGMPGLTNEKWKQNVQSVISLNIPHLSCYALTVEEKTPLSKLIKLGKARNVDPGRQSEQFLLLMQWLEEAGYEHYEISNFSKPGFRSRHNSSYWQRKKYMGIGPSAHSFNGTSRQWNVSNNQQYIESLNRGSVPFEKEELTPVQKLNEYIMTSLRTIEGLDLQKMSEAEGSKLKTAGKKYIDRGLMRLDNKYLVLTREGRLFADGIAVDLFFS